MCHIIFQLTGFVFTLLAIYIYGEEQESCKYPLSARTYISPKDYPSTHYAPIDAVQQARHSWCQPTYVTYADAIQWGQSDIANENTLQSGEADSSSRLCAQSTGSDTQTCYNPYNLSDRQTVINMDDQSMIMGHNSYTVAPLGSNFYQDFQTGTRMRNCDSASTDAARGCNSTSLWVNGPSSDDFGTVSPV